MLFPLLHYRSLSPDLILFLYSLLTSGLMRNLWPYLESHPNFVGVCPGCDVWRNQLSNFITSFRFRAQRFNLSESPRWHGDVQRITNVIQPGNSDYKPQLFSSKYRPFLESSGPHQGKRIPRKCSYYLVIENIAIPEKGRGTPFSSLTCTLSLKFE